MLVLVQGLFFAITETVFAWHMLTCDVHNQKIAFVFSLIAGAFWLLVVFNVVEYYERNTR